MHSWLMKAPENLQQKKTQTENINESTFQEFMNEIFDPTTGNMMKCHHIIANERTKETLEKAAANEFVRLPNGLQ